MGNVLLCGSHCGLPPRPAASGSFWSPGTKGSVHFPFIHQLRSSPSPRQHRPRARSSAQFGPRSLPLLSPPPPPDPAQQPQPSAAGAPGGMRTHRHSGESGVPTPPPLSLSPPPRLGAVCSPLNLSPPPPPRPQFQPPEPPTPPQDPNSPPPQPPPPITFCTLSIQLCAGGLRQSQGPARRWGGGEKGEGKGAELRGAVGRGLTPKPSPPPPLLAGPCD